MATNDDVFNLLKAVNAVTLLRMENEITALNGVILRLENELNAVNAVTLARMEKEIMAIKAKVGA